MPVVRGDPAGWIGSDALERHDGDGAAAADLARPEDQAALLDGYACAARQIAPAQSTEIARWSDRRRELLRKQSSRLRVGHLDLVMLP